MLNSSRNTIKHLDFRVLRLSSYATDGRVEKNDEFRVLNLKSVKGQVQQRRPPKQIAVLPPRTNRMRVDQPWPDVWPGPRTFHPASVPLPVRQGYVEKGAPPDKYANAELLKIPNFLHLTPPAIKRQCEALKRFCTKWPKGLEKDESCERHFPIEVISSDYCHSSPSIRDPLSRIVSVRFRLSSLRLDERARDKFLRLIGDRYEAAADMVTIVADRCPLRKQNYDYAMYLITALYHESWNVEPWEELKSEADMERYEWSASSSKKCLETLFGKPTEDIAESKVYSEAVDKLMNEGESEYTVTKYGEAVRALLKLRAAPS
ncbi:unnamed protein product [Phaedon cochleariae]|uniref:Small ribosomal subunit protein mS35 mitochondrial conserved domain-containing protein n=1 Tax=Phaedon cochleariae TaxID=80249 RepID=A0A9P0GVD4_PHACE|nr:unnamed protein product [Phaedon cochleariae]